MNTHTYRALNQGKRQSYLMGWAAGRETKTGERWEIEEKGPDRLDGYHSVVFPSPQSAEKAICEQRSILGRTGKLYVRAYAYETPNPANAKGMPLLESIEKAFWYLA